MYHMITYFNLRPPNCIEQFQANLEAFSQRMQNLRMVDATGPVGRRHRHPIMDTDAQRDQEYFFVMSFTNREQCDVAVEHIMSGDHDRGALHRSLLKQVDDPVFTCWEDV